MGGIGDVRVVDVEAQLNRDCMTFGKIAFIIIGKGRFRVTIGHGFVIGDDRDGEERDVGGRCIDEGDVVVGEIRTGEHGVGVEAGGRDSLVFAGFLRVEVVFDAGVVELDIVAFEDFVHDELVTRGDGVAVIGLVVGGESDADGQRRDVRQGRVDKRDVVVGEIRTGEQAVIVTFRRDGLFFAGVLVVEVVDERGVVEGDVVAFEDFVHDERVAFGGGVAVIDLVRNCETDVDGQRRDVGQSRVDERDVVVSEIGAGEK